MWVLENQMSGHPMNSSQSRASPYDLSQSSDENSWSKRGLSKSLNERRTTRLTEAAKIPFKDLLHPSIWPNDHGNHVAAPSVPNCRCRSHVPHSELQTLASGAQRTIARGMSRGLAAETYGALFLRCVSAARAESAAGPAVDVRRLRLTANPSLTRPKTVRRF